MTMTVLFVSSWTLDVSTPDPEKEPHIKISASQNTHTVCLLQPVNIIMTYTSPKFLLKCIIIILYQQNFWSTQTNSEAQSIRFR